MKPRRLIVLLLGALLLATPASAGAAASTTAVTTESYQALQSQINARKVVRATINRPLSRIKATLSDGSVQTVLYPPADERTLSDSLRHHGATVHFERKKKKTAAHHRLRYIAGGILAAIIIIGGGAYVIARRREADGPVGAGGTDAPVGTPPPPDAGE